MRSNKTIAILGGDARYLEMIRQLASADDVEIYLVGFDQLDKGFTGARQVYFSELEPEKLDAVILPITGMDERGYIEAVFSDKKIEITTDWFKKLSDQCLIFTGITNKYLNSVMQHTNLRLIPLFDRDDVAIYNSIPTVEGTIMMAIQHTDFTIHSSNVVVLGLGRVGMTIASKFAGLGAKVFVGAEESENIARIKEMGMQPFSLDDLAQYSSDCDLLINTIPALVVTEEAIQRMPSHALIIDLASKPGGTDFEYAKKRGIKALPAPSLPGIVAPKTAGEILGSVVGQLLKEHQGERSK